MNLVARKTRREGRRGLRWLLTWSAGLVALAVPLASAGVAAAATLQNAPMQTASVNGRVRATAFNGTTLYLVGDFTTATDAGNTVTRNHAAAIDTTTGHLLPWNPNANNIVYALAVDTANNVVYLGGSFTTLNGTTATKLGQVSGDTGVANKLWRVPVSGKVLSLSIGSNNLMYVGGSITKIGGQARTNAGAVNLSTVAVDPTWIPSISGGRIDVVDAVGNRVYVGGSADYINGSNRLSKLSALDPTTAVTDPTFYPSIGIPWEVFDVDVNANGIYAAVAGPGGWLWAMSSNGYTQWIKTVDGDMQAVTTVGNLIIGGGHFDYVCSSFYLGPRGSCTGLSWQRKKLFAVDSTGALQDWAPQGDSALGTYTLTTNADQTQIAAGGDFTAFNFHAIPQAHIALFNFS